MTLRTGFIWFLFIFFAVMFFRPIESEDVWLHLSLGRWTSQHGGAISTNYPFPLASEKSIQFCNDWLGSRILYEIQHLGGLVGLKVFRSLFFASLLLCCLLWFRRHVHFLFATTLTLLLGYVLLDRSFLRPDMFNCAFVLLTLSCLFNYELKPDFRKLLILPIMGVFWSNIHLGSFVYAVPIILIFLMAAIAKGKRISILHYCVILVFYLFSFCLSPYGFENLLYPFKVIILPQYLGLFKIGPYIQETQPLSLGIFSWACLHYWILLFIGIVSLFYNKTTRFASAILLIFATFCFFYMARNAAFFGVVVTVIALFGFKGIQGDLKQINMLEKVILILITVMMLGQLYLISTASFSYKGKRVLSLALEQNPYAIDVIHFLKDNNLHGATFNTTVLGGQMLWFGYPDIRPFDETRHIDQERFNNFIAILVNPQLYWDQAVNVYDIKTAVLNITNPSEVKLIKYLKQLPSWEIVWINGDIVIFVKKGIFNLKPDYANFREELQKIPVSDIDLTRIRTIINSSACSKHSILAPQPITVDYFKEGRLLINLDFKGAGLRSLRKGLEISQHVSMCQQAVHMIGKVENNL